MFSPDGLYLISGSSDGFVEVWDYEIGKLAKDLLYQMNDEFMMHDESILSLGCSKDGDMIASASSDGCLKIWRLRTGSCLKKLAAHMKGITSVEFSRDGSQILTSSYDSTIRLHGLNSGRMLKEFRGHASFVNFACYSSDGNRIISASSDGSVKIWDTKSSDCVSTFKLSPERSVLSAVPFEDKLLVTSKATFLVETNLIGHVGRSISVGKSDTVCSVFTANSPLLYALTEDSVVYIIERASGIILHAMKTHEKGAIGVAIHPHRNLLATFSDDGTLKLWKP